MLFPPKSAPRTGVRGVLLPYRSTKNQGKPPARRAITPSKQTVRVRYPSLKAGRMIECESALEGIAATYIDLSQAVIGLRSQPFTVSMLVNGQTKRYTPDFKVKLRSGRTLIIEVKPYDRCLVPEVLEKLRAAHAHFELRGYEFLVLTDLDLKHPIKQSNLRTLRYYARVPVSHQMRVFARGLVSRGAVSLLELEQQGIDKATVYSLIANHVLATDLSVRFGATSPISIAEENDHEKRLFEGRSVHELG